MTNIRILTKAVILTLLLVSGLALLLMGGFSFWASSPLSQRNGSTGILLLLITSLGIGLLGAAVVLLRRSNWLCFIPKSGQSRIYLIVVYGLLLPWFAICFVWGAVMKATPVSPISLQLQVMELLTLLSLPPLAGISIDLSIAKWADSQYKPTIKKVGVITLLIALSFTLMEALKYYIFKS